MERMKAELRSYFATPVAVAALPDTAALNGELKAIILAKEREDDGVQHSNLGGWQSSWDFESWGGAPAKQLLDAARDLAEDEVHVPRPALAEGDSVVARLLREDGELHHQLAAALQRAERNSDRSGRHGRGRLARGTRRPARGARRAAAEPSSTRR